MERSARIAAEVIASLRDDEIAAVASSPYAALGAIQQNRKGLSGFEQDIAVIELQRLARLS